MKTRHILLLFFCLMAGYFTRTPNMYAQSSTIDSLELILQTKEQTPTERLATIKELSWLYIDADARKAVATCNEGIRLAKQEKDESTASLLYRFLGIAYTSMNLYDSATIHLYKAIEYAKKAKNIYREIDVFITLGSTCRVQSKFSEALEHFFKALAFYEKVEGKEYVVGVILSNIGAIYVDMKNYDQAIAYILKSVEIKKIINDEEGMAVNFLNLSLIYHDKKDYDKALECLKEADKLYCNLNLIKGQIRVNQGYASLYSVEKDYEKALEYSKKALKMAQEHNFPYTEADSYQLLANISFQLGKYNDCEEAALKMLEIDSEAHPIRKIAYANLLMAYAAKRNIEKAIFYWEKLDNEISDFSNKNFQSSLSEMEVKYETEKKELKITAMEEERLLMIWLSIACGLILLLVLAFFIVRQRLAVNRRKLAEQQVKQLEQEKQLMATQAVLEGETAERTRLARDLHDGLGGMLSVVKLNLNDVKKGASMEGEDVMRFNQALNVLEDAVHELRRVAHNLMPDSLTSYGLKVSLNDFCNSIPIAEFHYFGNDERLDPKLEVMIYRTAHELVNNALKHAEANRIVVQIVHEADRLALTVQDDGCGFDLSEKTGGTGLKNIRNRVELYNGRMDIWSKFGGGTEASVEFSLIES
ncbi:MAG: tetratricopeptide repeat protein [Bacteroidales bacterium]|nr:tetratricopeptide repeat protein [Bacteroidales bacterium]